MRGVCRAEKEKAVELMKNGMLPSLVAKELDIPNSTIITWYGEIKRTRKRSINEIKIKLRENATEINLAEAKILSAASKILRTDISDDQWFQFQAIVTKNLQDLIIKNT